MASVWDATLRRIAPTARAGNLPLPGRLPSAHKRRARVYAPRGPGVHRRGKQRKMMHARTSALQDAMVQRRELLPPPLRAMRRAQRESTLMARASLQISNAQIAQAVGSVIKLDSTTQANALGSAAQVAMVRARQQNATSQVVPAHRRSRPSWLVKLKRRILDLVSLLM